MQIQPGPLLQHLPAIYHDPANVWLHHLLALFEDVLFGTGRSELRGLEDLIASTPGLLTPIHRGENAYAVGDGAPTPFLPWLAQWVGLSRHEGIPEARLRELIAEIVPLYGMRGTKSYLEKMLEYFLPEDLSVTVHDQDAEGLMVGASRVGSDTLLGGQPFRFRVTARARAGIDEREQRNGGNVRDERTIRAVVDLAKPAHTTYDLRWEGGASGSPSI